jgi:hypothetical protein
MLNRSSKIKIFCLFFLLPSQVFGQENDFICTKGKWRLQTETGVYQVEKIKICHDKSGVRFTSPDCQSHTRSCLPKIKNERKIEISKSFGSPGFRACYLFKGTPIFVEIWYEGSWYETSLCTFNGGKSFIDTDEMIRRAKELEER